MAQTDLDILIEHAHIRLPGSTTGTIQLELGALLREFCDYTMVWTAQTPFNTIVNQTAYILPDPPDGIVSRLLNVVDVDNRPTLATYAPPSTVVLGRTPNTVQALTANFVLLPDNYDPLGVPDWVLAKYRNGLLDGVTGRMMAQAAKPYSNAQGAIAYTTLYRKARAQAKNEVLHQFSFRGQGWIYPQAMAASRRNQRGMI